MRGSLTTNRTVFQTKWVPQYVPQFHYQLHITRSTTRSVTEKLCKMLEAEFKTSSLTCSTTNSTELSTTFSTKFSTTSSTTCAFRGHTRPYLRVWWSNIFYTRFHTMFQISLQILKQIPQNELSPKWRAGKSEFGEKLNIPVTKTDVQSSSPRVTDGKNRLRPLKGKKHLFLFRTPSLRFSIPSCTFPCLPGYLIRPTVSARVQSTSQHPSLVKHHTSRAAMIFNDPIFTSSLSLLSTTVRWFKYRLRYATTHFSYLSPGYTLVYPLSCFVLFFFC